MTVSKGSSRFVLLLLVAVTLAGCSDSGRRFADIDAYMAEVRQRPKPPVTPLPEFKPYEPFAYGAAGQRSPFEPPVPPRPPRIDGDLSDVKPDPNRVKQFLEQFPVGDLAMVGTLERNAEQYALIRDREGGVHRVTVGDYMGQDHGKILLISESSIELDEIVPDGIGGWLKRSRTVQLASSE
ncbi:MAG TPA: pilus assembly protein PilP [Pseudomonadales bacterium]|nr:pilus assembly protein PilP [Pseudomonadales bacterium]